MLSRTVFVIPVLFLSLRTLSVIARHEAISAYRQTLDCHVVPPRNDNVVDDKQNIPRNNNYVIFIIPIRHIQQQPFCYNQYMKTLTKTIIAIFIFSFFSMTSVHAENYETEIVTKVTQLQGIIAIMDQNPNLRTALSPFIISLVSDLQELLNQSNQEEITEKETETEETEKFDVTKTDRYPQQTFSDVTTSAQIINSSGDNNDYAEFEIEFDISAFGNNVFISENATDAIVFSIENSSTGSTVYDSTGTQNGNAIVSFSMTADVDDGYYRLDKDDAETITVNVSYNPYTGGTPPESGSYRMVMNSVEYAFSQNPATNSYTTRPSSKFRTKSVNIIN